MFDAFRKDLLYGWRSLRRQPGFAVVTILTLALGIGANTAVFSVVNGVLLRPLPYPAPERLEYITSQFPGLNFDQFWVSLPEFVEFRDHNRAFASVGAYNVGAANLGTTTPTRPARALVTPELMPTLGVPPLHGRWFTAADSVPNAPPAAILSYELWQRSFGGDRTVLGQRVQINNTSTEIVGVMPPGYDVHDERIELWLPLTINPANFPNSRGNHGFYLVGRLKDGISRSAALADLERLLNDWRTISPAPSHVPTPTNHRLRMDPLLDDMVGGVRQSLVVLQAAVGFVLLIACANLANLLVARADSRMREYAVRSALGATRGRLFRQLLSEGLILTIIAAAVGVGVAYAGLDALLQVNPDAIPRLVEITIDGRVLAFTLGVAIATGLVFALVPLVHVGRSRATEAFRESSTRTTAGSRRVSMRSLLVVGEIALAVTLVVGAGLLIRSFYALAQTNLGFNRTQLTTFGVVLPPQTYNPDQRVAFYGRLLERLRALPGVQSVAAMSGLPPLRNVNANDTDFEHIPPGRPPGSQPIENTDFWQFVSLGYADTMGISLVKGRMFDRADLAGTPVAMVNEALVARFFPDRDPVGQHLKPGFGDQLPWFTIIGVLRDVKQGGVAEAAGTEVYFLTDQLPKTAGFAPASMNFAVRSPLPLETLAPEYRRVVAELDKALPLVGLRSMDDVVGDAIARPRFLAALLSILAGLALGLAAVGTYGVLAYLVNQRRQEIGIRMALGANRATILALVLGRGLVLSIAGLIIGLGASLALTRLLGTMLYDISPTDPLTLAIVAGVMLATAVIACLVPAWRATRVDPLATLRAS
jgi:putative ABC transport system permease protein